MDGQLRQLRARWVASESDEDKAHYLRARVRAGEQDEESLRVGVWLGDEVAREVGAELLGDDAVTLVASKSGFAKLLEGLPGGPDVQTRALRAAYEAMVDMGELDLVQEAAVVAALACDQPPTPEQVTRARQARDALGPPGGPDMLLIMGIDALEELVVSGWTPARGRVAKLGLNYAGGRPERIGGVRSAVIAALLPWVYLRANAPPPKAPGEAPPTRNELSVFSPSAMTAAAAKAVLARAPAKRPTKDEARALIEAYLLALGWRLVRLSYLHPDEPIRIKLADRALRLEVGGPGHWARPTENGGRQILLIEVAQRLVEVARARG